MKHVAVIGLGYVGAPCAYFLAKACQVTAIDLDEGKLAKVRAGEALLEPEHFGAMARDRLDHLRPSADIAAVAGADFIFLSTPTDSDPKTGMLDTRALSGLIAQCLRHAPSATIVVRSTVPSGFMAREQAAHPEAALVFWPEFVRESRAYVDNMAPDRVIFGGQPGPIAPLRALIQEVFGYDDELIIEMGAGEAEIVKLAANTYLATRVAFINELDTLARKLGLDPKAVNQGLCSDTRIGHTYASPSLGFGGYCLPKDTLQFATLTQDFGGVLAPAVLAANQARMESFVALCQAQGARRVGFFRLVMKPGSDNAREAASLKIAQRLHEMGLEVFAYEPAARLIPSFVTAVDQASLFEVCDLVLAESWAGIDKAHHDKVVCPDLSA